MSLVLTGALLLSAGLAGARAAAAPLSADDVVRQALSNHPDSVAARAAIEVAQAERRSVGLLTANPVVEAQISAGYTYAQGVVPLSLTGAGWAARRASSLDADAARSFSHRTDLVVAAAARQAWLRASASERQAKLAQELLSLAGRLRQIVEARAAADEASALDVNLARVAEARAVADALALQAEAAERRQALAAFHPGALSAELGEPEDALPAASPGERSERSDITAARIDIDAARAALRRERAQVLPPIGLGAWVQSQDATSFGPFVEAELPIFTFRQGAVASARARLAVAEAEQARVEQVALAEQQTSTSLVEIAQAGIQRIEGVQSAARDALTAIDRGFDAGEIDLATALLLRTEVFDGWIASIDARAASVDAHLSALLAYEDEALLGGAP